MMKLLIKKDTRIIDIDDGFIIEAYIEQTQDYNHKIYVTHNDCPKVKLLISSVNPHRGVNLQGENDIVKFLRGADNYKDVWLSKLKKLEENYKLFNSM